MMPESEVGVTVTNGSTVLLPLTVGSAKAKELVYTSRKVSAAEAEEIGLVAGVYESETLEEKVLEVATDLVESKSSKALVLNKRAINQVFSIEEAMQQEETINEYCHAIEDVNWERD